jgi:hypothetical protein
MKLLQGALVAWMLLLSAIVFAQQPAVAPDPTKAAPVPQPAHGLQKSVLESSLQSPLLTTPNLPSWIALTATTFGVVTFVTPETRGGAVRVRIPAGDLAMRAARAMGGIERRRSERAAREEVARAIQALQFGSNPSTEAKR